MLDACRPFAARICDVVRPKGGGARHLPQRGGTVAGLPAPAWRWSGALGVLHLQAAGEPLSNEALAWRAACAELGGGDVAAAPSPICSGAGEEARDAASGGLLDLPPSLWWPSAFLPSAEVEAEDAEAEAEVETEGPMEADRDAPRPHMRVVERTAALREPREPTTTLAIYDTQLRKVENRYRELAAENRALKAASDSAMAEQERTRELNSRLVREIQQARRGVADAERRAAFAEAELRRARDDLRLTKRTAKRGAPRAMSVQPRAAEAPVAQADIAECHDEDTSQLDAAHAEAEPAATIPDAGHLGPATLEPEAPAPEPLAPEPLAPETCTCGAGRAWGCLEHLTYSSALLLAHQELSIAIVAGAPGLELDVPPGLGLDLRLAAAPPPPRPRSTRPLRRRCAAAVPQLAISSPQIVGV